MAAAASSVLGGSTTRGYRTDQLRDRIGRELPWADGDRSQPLLIDANVTSDQPSWWLEEAWE